MVVFHRFHHLVNNGCTDVFGKVLPDLADASVLFHCCLEHLSLAQFDHQVQLPLCVNYVIELHDTLMAKDL